MIALLVAVVYVPDILKPVAAAPISIAVVQVPIRIPVKVAASAI